MKLCFLDTETTSLEEGRLVQLAYELYDSNNKNGGIVVERKYKPPVHIAIEAMAVHHITEKMLEDKYPFQPGDLGDALENFVMVAHNAPFDIGVLVREGCQKPKYWIDTKKVAQYYLDYTAYNLQFLRYRFELEVEAIAHDALGDINVLKAVFMRLYQIALEEEGVSEQKMMQKLIHISINPIKLRRMVFGKHKGKLFDDIAKEDISYLQWLRKDTLTKPEADQDKDILYTISFYL